MPDRWNPVAASPVFRHPRWTSGFGATIYVQAAPGQPKERCDMQVLALFGPIGLPEMLIILAIVILIFGANRLPELGRGIGAGIKNFKSSVKDTEKVE
jgi:sec-independent protein translocase protein TatA